MQANLASIARRQEQVFLTTQMVKVTTDLWIGLSNIDRDRYVWTDGRPLSYFDWADKKLQKSTSRGYFLMWRSSLESDQCGLMLSSHSTFGKWELRSCNDKLGFICQRTVDPGIRLQAPTEFPRSWMKLGNDSYKILPQNLTWSEAQLQCVTEQSQLASILDELSAAYLELQALKLQTPLWIGLNKNETQGYFRWIDGWPLTMARWAQYELSRDRPCVYLDVDGTWKTALCNHTYPSVCKQSTAVPPTAPPKYPGECRHEDEDEGGEGWRSWLPFRGHCYSFITNEIDWPDASIDCTRRGR
ncbi:hypothetical protein UPYG_G00303550 [Umbra pygmaea]|uniref:C-type lectin domain-containing protein n=1 Tax=Umbra pygmaea TaxID=75934 RepID=A0ABD0W8C2_UMBPY